MLLEKGKLEKMILKVMEYVDGSKPEVSEDKTYTVQVNPASYSLTKNIQYQDQPSPGNQEKTANFSSSGPPTITFEVIFDGTGVINTVGVLDTIPVVGAIASVFSEEESFEVDDQIKKFEDIVYTLDGDIHQPNKIQISWGKLIFEGALNSISYSYTLFRPNGTPLRAKANCSFQGTQTAEQIALKAKKNSPDLTHLRELKDGDTLPLLAHKIYGNAELYLEVARVNKLINFRNLMSGTKVALPPIDKGTTL